MAAASCAAGAQQIVETRDLPQAGGAPSISAVTDLGGADIPLNGELRLRGRDDGVAVIGEALWIRGKAFGRQPTVSIAGRPAAVLSRTGDGGLLVRVPVGATPGPGTVSVRQEHGVAKAAIDVRRYGAVIAGGRLSWLDLSGASPVAAGESEVPGGRFVRMSADGRAAYVAGGRTLGIFELPAPGRPESRGAPDIGPAPVVALSSASAAHRLAVIREADLVLFDVSSPLRPELRGNQALPWPPAVLSGRVVRAELSPNGRSIAVALADRNRVVLLDLARSGDAAIVGDVALAGQTRAPVIADLAFAHDGHTLWVLAGDTADSKPLGPQETRVFALRVSAGPGALELARTVTVGVAVEPLRLSTGRSLPLASGAAVRLPPEKATVYLTSGVRDARRSAVFSVGAQDAATEVTASEGAARISGLDVTPEGRWLLAAAVEGTGLRLLSGPADGRPGAVRTLTLGAGSGSPLAEVRIQP